MAKRHREGDPLPIGGPAEGGCSPLLDLPGVAVGQLELADGRYVAADTALCELTGCTSEELVGREFLDLAHPEDRDRLGNLDLPLIAISEYAFPADHERSPRAGFRAHLVKPVDFASLRTVLAELLAPETSGGSRTVAHGRRCAKRPRAAGRSAP